MVLTMGNRPADLRAGLESLLAQRDVVLDVVVVGNGWEPTGLPEGVRGLGLPVNRGIPAGRNAGVGEVAGDLLFFLDDDAVLPTDDVLSRMAAQLAADPTLGLIQPRVVDPEGREAPRRWTPRVRVGDPGRSSPATACSTVLLPDPDGPNSTVTPGAGAVKAASRVKGPKRWRNATSSVTPAAGASGPATGR